MVSRHARRLLFIVSVFARYFPAVRFRNYESTAIVTLASEAMALHNDRMQRRFNLVGRGQVLYLGLLEEGAWSCCLRLTPAVCLANPEPRPAYRREVSVMGGNLAVWGESKKTHDDLIKSLRPLAKERATSLQKLSSNLRAMQEQTEAIAQYVAKSSNIPYSQQAAKEDPSLPLDTIIRSLKETRPLMELEAILFYRSQLRKMNQFVDRVVETVDELARVMRDSRNKVKKLSQFYEYSQQEERAARQALVKPKASRQPKRR